MNKYINIKNIFLTAMLLVTVIYDGKNHLNPDDNGEIIKGTVSAEDNWAPNTKKVLDKIIHNNAGRKGAYAVFDWDDTSVYADVADNLFLYQIENLAFKMTPDEFEYSFTHYADSNPGGNMIIPKDNFVSPYFSIEGKPINIEMVKTDCANDYRFFYDNYKPLNPESSGNLTLNEITKTDQFRDFKAKMWFTYAALENSFDKNVAYTWLLFVSYTGYSPDELKRLTLEATDWGIKKEIKKVYFDSPVSMPGVSGVIINSEIDNYFRNAVRPIPEIGSLFEKLKRNKIAPYICTASLQDIIEAVAENTKYNYNLPIHHVMGMRLKIDSEGKFLPEYDFSNGYNINSMAGKASNINELLVSKFLSNPVFVAGDSDGDYDMITKFSGLNGAARINDLDPLQLVIIVNRLKGGKIGEICKIAADQLSGARPEPTMVILQGRDENKGCWIPTGKTLKLGLQGADNLKLLH